MAVRQFGSYPSPLGPDYKSFLDKERLVNFLESTLILPYRSRYGIGTYRTSLEVVNNGPQYLVVNRIESPGIYLELVKCIFCYAEVDAKSLTLLSSPFAIRGVPRLRRAISRAALSSISIFNIEALLQTIFINSSVS